MFGWVVIDKASGPTSMAVTSKVKRLFLSKKAGHAGTLDPLASGVLPIALGQATRLIPFLMNAKKTYEFTVAWGERTTTDDCQGTVCATSSFLPSYSDIQAILPAFTELIQQVPPIYSAMKVCGERAYTLARRGEDFHLDPRTVCIHSIGITHHQENITKFTTTCSSGTYVRSLARDMAHHLGTEGHIIQLRRTQVGPFLCGTGLDFLEKIDYNQRTKSVQPPQYALENFDACHLTAHEWGLLRTGQVVKSLLREGVWACYYEGELVALASCEKETLKPTKCFKVVS